jgi:hypothetical protein
MNPTKKSGYNYLDLGNIFVGDAIGGRNELLHSLIKITQTSLKKSELSEWKGIRNNCLISIGISYRNYLAFLF